MIESRGAFMFCLAIVTLLGSGCSSSGSGIGPNDPRRFAACLPSCIADELAWCPIPAGACTSESISDRETSSCYSGGVKTLVYSDAGGGVWTASGPCPYQTYRTYTIVAPLQLQSILYANGANAPYGCITMDATDPNNRKGTARCGIDCQEATGSTDPGQPVDFDSPACSFFRFQYCGAGCTMTDGLPYDDPNQMCSQGATGSCPAP